MYAPNLAGAGGARVGVEEIVEGEKERVKEPSDHDPINNGRNFAILRAVHSKGNTEEEEIPTIINHNNSQRAMFGGRR